MAQSKSEPAPIDRGPMRPVEFYILLALARGEQHGYAIMQRTEESSGGDVKLDAGTLYRAIKRLRDAGLLDEADRKPATDAHDQRRRYYRLTAAGQRAATNEARRLAHLVREAGAVHLLDDPAPA